MLTLLQINLKCIDCDNCRIICPENAILRVKNKYHLDQWCCTLCGICVEICPVDAIIPTQSEKTTISLKTTN